MGLGLGLKPAEPLSGVYTLGTSTLVLTFDQPLQANPALNIPNWFIRADDKTRGPVTAIAAGSDVTITTGLPFVQVGPDVVSYSPPPFDLISANALPVDAFADFSISVVP